MLQSNVFGLTWDIGHFHAAENVDEKFLLAHSSKLCHFHIHDSVGKENHRILGTGEIDLNQKLYVAKDHACRCVVETKTVDALKKSLSWLRKNHWM